MSSTIRLMFTLEDRERVRNHVLHLAQSDRRIIAGAAVGSDALGRSDRWSDLDLTFGLAEGVSAREVLDDWTANLDTNFGAIHLFDLPDRATIYRVFLLPGNLQVDLSFTSGFVAEYGPKFKLLFGTAVRKEHSHPRSERDAFGWAVHHAVRARYCIERGRAWGAECWISGVRDEALSLACLRRGLEAHHGRGVDLLPSEVLAAAAHALVRSLDRRELLRALRSSIDLLFMEGTGVGDLAGPLEKQLRDLAPLDGH